MAATSFSRRFQQWYRVISLEDKKKRRLWFFKAAAEIKERQATVTYKLKLNGGDIKAVQGDSGHAQVNMVTDVYSHILDDDRRKNAELFEEAFYEKKNLDPQMHVQQENNNATVADEIDPELLAKVLANPEMRALLNSLAKTMK